jgi:hypothetical protein
VLLLEGWAQRVTRSRTAWTAVVAVNGRIMTLYLWHVTAMVLIIGLSLAVGGFGLGAELLTTRWWVTRPVWYFVLALTTVLLAGVFGRFETPRPPGGPCWPWSGPALHSPRLPAVPVVVLAISGVFLPPQVTRRTQ